MEQNWAYPPVSRSKQASLSPRGDGTIICTQKFAIPWGNSVRIFLAATIGLSLICSKVSSQSNKYRDEAMLLKKTILQHHVAPRPLDDKFSEWVFHDFLEELDPDRLYFTENDLSLLQPSATRLDDE